MKNKTVFHDFHGRTWLTALSIFAEFPETTLEKIILVHRIKDDTRDRFCTSACLFPVIKNKVNMKSFACLIDSSRKKKSKKHEDLWTRTVKQRKQIYPAANSPKELWVTSAPY